METKKIQEQYASFYEVGDIEYITARLMDYKAVTNAPESFLVDLITELVMIMGSGVKKLSIEMCEKIIAEVRKEVKSKPWTRKYYQSV